MRKAIQCILSFVLIVGVLVTGGVHTASYSLMEVCIFLVFFLVLLQQLMKGKITLPFPPVLAVLIVILVFQLIPLPPTAIQWISPQRWEGISANVLAAGAGWTPMSVYPHATGVAFLKVLSYLAVFVLSAYLFDSQKRSAGLVTLLIGVGLLEAALGLTLYLGGWQDLLPFVSDYPSTRARGSYINPNHFAAVLTMTLPFLFGWVYYLYEKRKDFYSPGEWDRPASKGHSRSGQVSFYTFLIPVMLIALALSGSRMGILSGLASLLFLVLLIQLKGREARLLASSFLVLGGVLAYLLWIGLDPVISRFETVLEGGYLDSSLRVLVWKDELDLFRDYPWLGTGLGTFGTVFKEYQTAGVRYWFDNAHNDYLQFATELGIVGFSLLFGPIFYLMVRMIRSFTNDRSRYRSSVTLGCIGGTFALLVHSVTDFNLQIPANAMIFAVILGIGYKASCVEPRAESLRK